MLLSFPALGYRGGCGEDGEICAKHGWLEKKKGNISAARNLYERACNSGHIPACEGLKKMSQHPAKPSRRTPTNVGGEEKKHLTSHRFLLFSYSQSPERTIENVKARVDNGNWEEGYDYPEQEYENGLAIKGMSLHEIAPEFLVGIGGYLGFEMENEDNSDYTISPWHINGYMGGNFRIGSHDNQYIYLIPYAGIGLGKINLDIDGLPGKLEGDVGLSYDLGVLFRVGRLGFGLSHSVINNEGSYKTSVSFEGIAYDWEEKFDNKTSSTVLSVGLAF